SFWASECGSASARSRYTSRADGPMPSSKYPLKPLLEHRERQADDATAALGHAVKTREVAESARVRAERERRAAEARAVRVRAEGDGRLLRGELSVADLARGQAWEVGATAQIDQLARAVDAAEEKLEEARGGETEARLELARRIVDRDVIAKDE